ncbi:MAG TPA: polyphosphate:AMP phosphotransferase [Polyangiaceae bacterium]|nr:polyphosphate:AMP phosphotransferase [Polyangiaceae bacterium]
MFETAELGRTLDKATYEALVPELRTRLLKAQTALEKAGFSVVVLLNGVGGMAETTNRLYEWLDARYLVTEAWSPPSEEERERPEFWRYSRWLPPAGRIGVFLGSWYTRPIVERAEGRAGRMRFGRELARIAAFERALADDGVLFVKLWFHLSKRDQRRRLRDLEAKRTTRFRVGKHEWQRLGLYDEFRHVSERAVRETSTALAPWTVIEATDARYRDVEAAKQLLAAVERRLAEPPRPHPPEPEAPASNPRTILDTLDYSSRVARDVYERRLGELQARLNHLAARLERKRRGLILVFEGPDAAGKGGAIRRVIGALDAQQYRVIPISAPTEEERAHHYLWRFWRHLPRRGRITIYDRSWYGRVLVERVEGLATREEWSRAYREINEFERELVDDGIVLVKFWLHVTSEEQLRRFHEREREPWKQHKITAEDYRNRRHENRYELAANEMIERNSTEYAPFELVAADDKHGARLHVLEAICRRLEAAL